MKRLLGGGAAFGLATVGALALGGPVGAQEGEEVFLDAEVSPELVAPGEDVTVTSVDPCTVTGGGGELLWATFPVEGIDVADEGGVALDGDGSWSVTFAAPSDPGDYEFYAVCAVGDLPPEETEELEELLSESPDELIAQGGEPEPEEPGEEEPPMPTEIYGPEHFAVAADEQPPTSEPEPGQPAPPVAAPAVPVPGEPSYTG